MTKIDHARSVLAEPRRILLAGLLVLVAALATSFASAPAADAASRQYRVCVTTGTLWGAGTDANVAVSLNGTLGSTNYVTLDGPGNDFEAGNTDCFTFWERDIGALRSVAVWTDAGGGWYLKHIQVNGLPACWANKWMPSGTTTLPC